MDEAHFTQADRRTLTQVETKLDRAIDDIKSLSTNFASKNDLDDLEKRVISLEDNNKWVVRAIIGIVISALIGILITGAL